MNSQVLVLNRLWQAVNICSARRAFSLVYAGHAQIVSSDDANNFSTHDFESWRDLSTNAPDHESVTTISFKIRIPRVIVLLVFDRLPKKEVKFTRHNVFERDKNTCQVPAAISSIAVTLIWITSCRATGAGRRLGKTWFARVFRAIRAKATGFRAKRT